LSDKSLRPGHPAAELLEGIPPSERSNPKGCNSENDNLGSNEYRGKILLKKLRDIPSQGMHATISVTSINNDKYLNLRWLFVHKTIESCLRKISH
jgi:hypothetical protein